MQFSNSSQDQKGLVEDARYLSFSDSNNYAIGDVTRSINHWYQQAVEMIWKASSHWMFDDSNNTGFAVATSTLVNGQNDYSLPVSVVTSNVNAGGGAMIVERVEVEDSGGNWSIVNPIDERQIGQAIPEFYKTAGMPKYYRLVQRSVWLHPAPDNGVSVTLAGGLRIYFQREVVQFSTSSTTAEPGFDRPFHRILSVGAAYDFAIAKGRDNAGQLKGMLDELISGLKLHYAVRHKDFKTAIRPVRESYL